MSLSCLREPFAIWRFSVIKPVPEVKRMHSKRKLKGSLTIEAACIMPVVLLTVFSCLYLCFYVHNRTFLTAAACESAVTGSIESVKENSSTYEAARERSILLGNTGFFGAEDLNTGTSAGESHGDPITVSYSLRTVFSPFAIDWALSAEGEAYVIRPAEVIRELRREG